MKMFVVAVALMAATSSLRAQFVTADKGLGSDSLVFDAISAKTWLNLDITEGISFDEALTRWMSSRCMPASERPGLPI